MLTYFILGASSLGLSVFWFNKINQFNQKLQEFLQKEKLMLESGEWKIESIKPKEIEKPLFPNKNINFGLLLSVDNIKKEYMPPMTNMMFNGAIFVPITTPGYTTTTYNHVFDGYRLESDDKIWKEICKGEYCGNLSSYTKRYVITNPSGLETFIENLDSSSRQLKHNLANQRLPIRINYTPTNQEVSYVLRNSKSNAYYLGNNKHTMAYQFLKKHKTSPPWMNAFLVCSMMGTVYFGYHIYDEYGKQHFSHYKYKR